MDKSYSADVEIDEKGKLVFARDIGRGEVIHVPSHMLKHMQPGSMNQHTLRIPVSTEDWQRLWRGSN